MGATTKALNSDPWGPTWNNERPDTPRQSMFIVPGRMGNGKRPSIPANYGAADSPAELSESNQKFRPIASILGELDEIYLAGCKPRLGEMLHLYLLGVSDRVAGHGIAQQLVLRTVEHGASKGYKIAFAESTNRRSQHIFRKLGFSERAQILYGEHVFEGQNFFAVVAEHGGPILMEKVLAGA